MAIPRTSTTPEGVSAHLDMGKLAAARLRAVETQPFLGTALFALRPIPAPGLDTMGVSEDLLLFIDPVVLTRWTIPQIAGVLLHEVGHVVRDHAGRARTIGVATRGNQRADSADHRCWNVAGDAEINDDLISDGAELPGGGVTPKRLGLPNERTAEFYFAALMKRSGLPDVDCGPGAHGHEPAEGSPMALARAAAEQANAERAAGDGQINEQGSGHAENSDDAVPWFSRRDDLGLDPSQVDLIRLQVARAIVLGGHTPGSKSSGWKRWAAAFEHPVVDWRTVLRRSIRSGLAVRAGRTDYSYQRQSRRQVAGFILPSTVAPLSTVGIVIDTSASMPDTWVSLAWAETLACLKSIGMRKDLIRAYGTDTSAVRVSRFTKEVPLSGGGGTDLSVGIDAALRDRPRPGLLVAITDGFTPWPSTPTPVPLVVVLIHRERVPDTPVWATTINVSARELET
jgi:predicted metal-dependent peptidase